MDKELKTYEKHVRKLAEENSDELILNGLMDHAKILVTNLLLNTKKELRIFSSSLKSELYDDPLVLDALTNFIGSASEQQQKTVTVLLQNSDSLGESKFLSILTGDGLNKNIKVNLMEVVETNDQEIKQHFITSDNGAYRFCPDKEGTKATASFNREDDVRHLVEQFKLLTDRAKAFVYPEISAQATS